MLSVLSIALPSLARAAESAIYLEYAEMGREDRALLPQSGIRITVGEEPALEFVGSMRVGDGNRLLKVAYDARSSRWAVTSSDPAGALVRQTISDPTVIQVVEKTTHASAAVGCGYTHESKIVFYRLNIIVQDSNCPTQEDSISSVATVGFELVGGKNQLTVSGFTNDTKSNHRDYLGRMEVRASASVPGLSQPETTDSGSIGLVEKIDLAIPKVWLKRGHEPTKLMPPTKTGSTSRGRNRSRTKQLVSL